MFAVRMKTNMVGTIIEKHLKPEDDFIYGFADLHGLLNPEFSKYPFGISIGKRLDDSILDRILDGPTLEYFEHYNNINRELAEITFGIQKDLKTIDIDSIPIKPTISLKSAGYKKYLNSLSYDISHKMVATRAGLGWIGKTDLLVSRKFGPRLRLVTILLDHSPGKISVPIEKSHCGKCNICVEKCPARAANGKIWNIEVHRDQFFNAFRCREKCGELARQRLNVDERICGLCVSVCPVGGK